MTRLTHSHLQDVAARPHDTVSPVAGSSLRRIACISTSRADAGIYRPLLEALGGVEQQDVTLLAGGTHLSESFGQTINEFASLPRLRIRPVDHHVAGDDPCSVAETAGRAMGQFARAIAEIAPDLVFVLGDRTEMLAATLAAVVSGVPIAHLNGGDTTEGAYDDACRHAMTKLSHLHFPALLAHAARIAAMGEEPWRIHCVGALALDAIARFRPPSRESLARELNFDPAEALHVVIFHPETLASMPVSAQIAELVAVLDGLRGCVMILGPNADVGRDTIAGAWREVANHRPKTLLLPSMPQKQFWGCLAHATVLIGNSSAGIIEAASFGLPVVNVGDRQKGRVRAANVLDVPLHRIAISRAISLALNPAFRASLAGLANPYGDGHAAERILSVLSRLSHPEDLLKKK